MLIEEIKEDNNDDNNNVGWVFGSLSQKLKNASTENSQQDLSKPTPLKPSSQPPPPPPPIQIDDMQHRELPTREKDQLDYLGILDLYMDSQNDKPITTENTDENKNETKQKDEDKKRCRIQLLFVIIYTIFALLNFILIYNMLNYYALVLQIINLSLSYLMIATIL